MRTSTPGPLPPCSGICRSPKAGVERVYAPGDLVVTVADAGGEPLPVKGPGIAGTGSSKSTGPGFSRVKLGTVELPAAGGPRAWTLVERSGRRVAALLHDVGKAIDRRDHIAAGFRHTVSEFADRNHFRNNNFTENFFGRFSRQSC